MPPAVSKWHGNPWAILITLSLGFFMTLLDLTIVNIAIPSMITDLDASLDEILWVVNAYVLVLAVLLITAGRLGDLRGQRTLFVAGVVVFTLASLACGLSPNPTLLIAFRAVQGVGAAMLMPQTMAIIIATFPADRRGTALGIWGAVAGLATVAGPTLGGVLVTYASWRWIFIVNVPGRAGGAGDDVRLHPRHPDGARAQARPARRRPRHRRPVLPDVRPDRGPALLVERRDHRLVRGSSSAHRGLPAAAARPPGRGAAGAVLAVPQPQLHGDQRRRVPGLRRDPRLLPPVHHLPAVRAGLLGHQGGADPGADVRDRPGPGAVRREDVGPGRWQVHPDDRPGAVRPGRGHPGRAVQHRLGLAVVHARDRRSWAWGWAGSGLRWRPRPCAACRWRSPARPPG